jgi:hypothetical protein
MLHGMALPGDSAYGQSQIYGTDGTNHGTNHGTNGKVEGGKEG